MQTPSIPESWKSLRFLLESFFTLFGEPARIAALRFITALHGAEMFAWLRPLERMARLLLLAEAAGLALPASRKPGHRRREGKGRFPGLDLSAPQSKDWRVFFQALPPARSASLDRRASQGGVGVFSSRAMAARLEALVRVALDPSPYARRLAGRLARRFVSRKRLRPLFRRPPDDAFPLARALHPYIDVAIPARARFESG